MRYSGLLVLAALALFCAACAPHLDATADFQAADDSYFVIGAGPDTMQVVVTRGTLTDGKYDLDRFARPAYGQDGYIVAKAPAGDFLGISEVFYHPADNSFFGTTPFIPCGDARTVTFTARAGTVVYITDVEYYAGAGGRLQARYRQNIEAARQFLKTHYPKLADRLTQGDFQMLQAPGACQI